MSEQNKEPRTVTVIGAGTIGLSWIALFLGYGLRVRVNSRRPEAERIVQEGIALFAPFLPEEADRLADSADRLEFEPNLETAVADADVIVENAPDNLELKQELFERVGKAAPAGALILSSTSMLSPDAMGARMADRSRLVVGHPFNPPHVVPLIEVVAGEETDPEAVREAVEFYRSVGRVPVVLRKQILAFAANRLQNALLRESIHLVREGVVTVGELDEVVTNSIGLRWSTIGPFHAFHLGGGEGGLRKWLTGRAVGMEQGWELLGRPRVDDDLIETLVAQAEEAFGDKTYAELVRSRDTKQLAVLKALASVAPNA
ncbi:3-hydroxyacyl-CoA dehydrogenase NAD-binding domain-containing protein [Streptomyces sp. NPDC052069]|uniref:3-hydroxyacyl-CoA dehydrogenase NAD-binding domain-containing protein n=1 Tax=Streptomyces sp. NPDC052069 TaxID=3154650 RepID=UPI00341794D7